VPALRERLTDLDALTEALLEQIALRSGMPQRELTPAALQRLSTHEWRGNVRELRNALEQVAMLTDKIRLDAEDFEGILQSAARGQTRDGASAPLRVPSPLPQRIAELERESIHSALAATGGNKVSAAKLLGISRATLYEKLAAMRTTPPDVS
jgi:DNA-binding NtrC family response regulator